MDYTVSELAKLSNVTKRTLHYYDSIGLLKPKDVKDNGYRVYGSGEVDLLQQILFYRELGMELGEIKELLYSPKFDKQKAMKNHLQSLTAQRARLDKLLNNVEQTLRAMKGEYDMKDKEKFEGFKREAIEKNEKEYGSEIRAKYGNDAIDASNAKFSKMDENTWKAQDALENEIRETLKQAMLQGDPKGETAMQACELHKNWLTHIWKDGTYSKAAHLAMGEMYIADERFKKYYDSICEGAAEFFYDALKEYCK